jgi:hypothetical protein
LRFNRSPASLYFCLLLNLRLITLVGERLAALTERRGDPWVAGSDALLGLLLGRWLKERDQWPTMNPVPAAAVALSP